MFARTIGLPNDPIEATGDLLDALADGSIHRVGLGSVNGRYFLFHVGMGFDAAVVAQVERRSGLKRYAGHPLFVFAPSTPWFRHYDRSRPRFSVRFADGSVVDDGYLSICLNTNPYTYLGQPPPRPRPRGHARPRARVGDVAHARVRCARCASSAPRSRGGRHLRSSRWTEYRSDLTGSPSPATGPFPYQVDGDHLGDTERLEIRTSPRSSTSYARLPGATACASDRGRPARRRGRW